MATVEGLTGEYKVFKILHDEVVTALSEFGITGVDVRRFAQANFTTGDKLVLIHLVATERVGWQAFKYGTERSQSGENKFMRSDEWIEQQSWQFSFLKKMMRSDTIDTITADDICNRILAWFNGIGNLNIRLKGIANLPIDPTSVMVYNDDSDLYQRRPVFTMEVQVPKSFMTEIGSTDTLVQNHFLP